MRNLLILSICMALANSAVTLQVTLELLFYWGWDFVPIAALPFIMMAGLAAIWLMLQRRRVALGA